MEDNGEIEAPAEDGQPDLELVDRGFGSRVGRAGEAYIAQRGDRGDIDDGADALRDHLRKTSLTGQIHALGVDGEEHVPVFFGCFLRTADVWDADIVVQDVDAAIGV